MVELTPESCGNGTGHVVLLRQPSPASDVRAMVSCGGLPVASSVNKSEPSSEEQTSTSIDAIAEALQAEGAEPLAQIVGALDLHFWLLNLDPMELVYASPATLRAWGLGEGSAELRAPRVHPQDIERYANLFSAASGEAREAEYRVLEESGDIHWRHSRVFPIRDAAGKVVRLGGMTEDVTARKQAEQEIAVHRAFERLITRISADLVNLSAPRMDEAFQDALAEFGEVVEADYAGIALADNPDGTLRVRWQWSRYGPPPALTLDLTAAEASAIRAMAGGPEGFVLRSVHGLPAALAETTQVLLQSGVRSVVDAPLNSNDELFGFLGFASTDERKIWPAGLSRLAQIAADMFANAIDRIRSETAMRAHLDQLAHVLRLGTMGQLASGMAHELNQPLAAIMNYVHACERRIDAGRIDAQGLRAAVRAIGAQATRAADVIKALRALVKAESRREHEELGALVREALRLLDTEASKRGIRVHFDAGDDGATVHVDVIQIQQVVLNLLQNAFDAIDASGADQRAVYVSTRVVAADNVEVSVRDTGPGVAHDKLELVFDDFYTSKPQGLGLGLSISRSLIEAHGGRLWLDPDLAEGACFRFMLPVLSGGTAERHKGSGLSGS